MIDSSAHTDHRKLWMAVLAKADWEQLDTLWQQNKVVCDYKLVRGPETGLVMAQGRMGGSGAPFNVGEITVTRCSVRLSRGDIMGHSYVMGRNRKHAETAALIDGLMQDPGVGPQVESDIIVPLQKVHAARRQNAQSKAAATKVDFFTLVRGEDE